MYIVYGVESLCKSSFTERNLIGWRTESNRVAYGIRSGGERNLIGWRTESDRVANAIGGKTKETTAPNKVLWFP